MAFPTIQTADTKTGTVTTNSTPWSLTYPSNLQAGDLILVFMGIDGTSSATFPGGFVLAGQASGGACFLLIAKKLSDGTESGTFSVTTASEQGGWAAFRVTGWSGTLGSSFSSSAASGGVNASSIATGATNTPDSSSLNPTNWDVEDTLWFSVCAADTSRTVSVYPLASNNNAVVSGGSGGATVAYCTTNSAVASLDPGTFTISAADEWAAVTIAIRPAAAAAARRPYRQSNQVAVMRPSLR